MVLRGNEVTTGLCTQLLSLGGSSSPSNSTPSDPGLALTWRGLSDSLTSACGHTQICGPITFSQPWTTGAMVYTLGPRCAVSYITRGHLVSGQGRNCLTMQFTEHVPVIKQRKTHSLRTGPNY